jgi:hypothetical protein
MEKERRSKGDSHQSSSSRQYREPTHVELQILLSLSTTSYPSFRIDMGWVRRLPMGLQKSMHDFIAIPSRLQFYCPFQFGNNKMCSLSLVASLSSSTTPSLVIWRIHYYANLRPNKFWFWSIHSNTYVGWKLHSDSEYRVCTLNNFLLTGEII